MPGLKEHANVLLEDIAEFSRIHSVATQEDSQKQALFRHKDAQLKREYDAAVVQELRGGGDDDATLVSQYERVQNRVWRALSSSDWNARTVTLGTQGAFKQATFSKLVRKSGVVMLQLPGEYTVFVYQLPQVAEKGAKEPYFYRTINAGIKPVSNEHVRTLWETSNLLTYFVEPKQLFYLDVLHDAARFMLVSERQAEQAPELGVPEQVAVEDAEQDEDAEEREERVHVQTERFAQLLWTLSLLNTLVTGDSLRLASIGERNLIRIQKATQNKAVSVERLVAVCATELGVGEAANFTSPIQHDADSLAGRFVIAVTASRADDDDDDDDDDDRQWTVTDTAVLLYTEQRSVYVVRFNGTVEHFASESALPHFDAKLVFEPPPQPRASNSGAPEHRTRVAYMLRILEELTRGLNMFTERSSENTCRDPLISSPVVLSCLIESWTAYATRVLTTNTLLRIVQDAVWRTIARTQYPYMKGRWVLANTRGVFAMLELRGLFQSASASAFSAVVSAPARDVTPIVPASDTVTFTNQFVVERFFQETLARLHRRAITPKPESEQNQALETSGRILGRAPERMHSIQDSFSSTHILRVYEALSPDGHRQHIGANEEFWLADSTSTLLSIVLSEKDQERVVLQYAHLSAFDMSVVNSRIIVQPIRTACAENGSCGDDLLVYSRVAENFGEIIAGQWFSVIGIKRVDESEVLRVVQEQAFAVIYDISMAVAETAKRHLVHRQASDLFILESGLMMCTNCKGTWDDGGMHDCPVSVLESSQASFQSLTRTDTDKTSATEPAVSFSEALEDVWTPALLSPLPPSPQKEEEEEEEEEEKNDQCRALSPLLVAMLLSDASSWFMKDIKLSQSPLVDALVVLQKGWKKAMVLKTAFPENPMEQVCNTAAMSGIEFEKPVKDLYQDWCTNVFTSLAWSFPDIESTHCVVERTQELEALENYSFADSPNLLVVSGRVARLEFKLNDNAITGDALALGFPSQHAYFLNAVVFKHTALFLSGGRFWKRFSSDDYSMTLMQTVAEVQTTIREAVESDPDQTLFMFRMAL